MKMITFLIFMSTSVAALTIDRDDRRPLSPSIIAQHPFNKIVRVVTPTKVCSGAIVGTNLVLTAAHCFCQDDESKEIDDVNIGTNNCMNEKRRLKTKIYTEYHHGNFRDEANAVFVTNSPYFKLQNLQDDFAFIKVDKNIGHSGILPLDETFYGQSLIYYMNSYKLIAYHQNKNTGKSLYFQNKECHWAGPYLDQSTQFFNLFKHTCDTAKMSSGAPILECDDKNNSCVIKGLNVASNTDPNNPQNFAIWTDRFYNMWTALISNTP